MGQEVRGGGAAAWWPRRWRAVVAVATVAACSDPGSPADVTVSRIEIEPATASVSAGSMVPLSARAFDAAGTELPSHRVFWSSENASVASVSQAGVVSGVVPGQVQIAASADGVSGMASVSVTPRSTTVPVAQVRVTPTTASAAVNAFVQLTATTLDAAGNTLSGRVVMWSSSNQSVAIVSSTGRVHGVSQGSATITAASEGRSGTAQVTITSGAAAATVQSVLLTMVADSVWVGGTVSGTVTPRDAAGNPLAGQLVGLTSSAPAVATVSPASGTSGTSGALTITVSGVAVGTARIMATSNGKGDNVDVRVLAPVQTVSMSPTVRNVEVGKTTTLTATARNASGAALAGRVCTISSANPAIASASPSSGITNGNGEVRITVTGNGLGLVTITATCEGRSASSAVTVFK